MNADTNINATTTQDPAAQPAQQPATDRDNSGSSNGAKTFTQEHMSHETGKARKEARESAIADVLKKTGAATLEELIARNEEAQKRKESEMSEAQKAQALAQQAIKDRDDAIAERDKERSERRNDKIAAALSTAASKLQAKDTDDVLRYARDKYADELNAMMDESGAIDTKKVDSLLEKIKADKGHYFSDGKTVVQATVIPSNANGRIGNGEADALKRASLNNQRIIRG